MSKTAMGWAIGITIAALVLSFFIGVEYDKGGEYTLDVYSGSTHYAFPLNYAKTQQINLDCVAPEDKIVLSVSVDGTQARSLQFCGSAVFQSGALRAQ